MAAKLIDEISDFLVKEASSRYDLELVRSVEIDNGLVFEFRKGTNRFGVVLRDFDNLKLSFFLYHELSDNEMSYWSSNYKFKVFVTHESKNYQLALNILQVKNFINSDDTVKIIMERYLETIQTFRRDFKWIVFMERSREVAE